MKDTAPALATFLQAIDLSDTAGLMNRAAEAALNAFREIGEHLAASERGQLVSGRGLDGLDQDAASNGATPFFQLAYV